MLITICKHASTRLLWWNPRDRMCASGSVGLALAIPQCRERVRIGHVLIYQRRYVSFLLVRVQGTPPKWFGGVSFLGVHRCTILDARNFGSRLSSLP